MLEHFHTVGEGWGDLSSNFPKFTKICPFYCPHMPCFSKIFSDVTHDKCRAKVVDKNLMAFAQYEKHKMFQNNSAKSWKVSKSLRKET